MSSEGRTVCGPIWDAGFFLSALVGGVGKGKVFDLDACSVYVCVFVGSYGYGILVESY